MLKDNVLTNLIGILISLGYFGAMLTAALKNWVYIQILIMIPILTLGVIMLELIIFNQVDKFVKRRRKR